MYKDFFQVFYMFNPLNPYSSNGVLMCPIIINNYLQIRTLGHKEIK